MQKEVPLSLKLLDHAQELILLNQWKGNLHRKKRISNSFFHVHLA